MFHVKQILFVRTDMDIEGVGTVSHVAELQELDEQTCHMNRIIELGPDDVILGAADGEHIVGQANRPQKVVPHPSTYGNYADITSSDLSAEEFEALWAEAITKFNDLATEA